LHLLALRNLALAHGDGRHPDARHGRERGELMTEEPAEQGHHETGAQHARARLPLPCEPRPQPRAGTGARIADVVTEVFGSWRFNLGQSAEPHVVDNKGYAAAYFLHTHEFDPYPFILPNWRFRLRLPAPHSDPA
jgi:hypothetical protein